MVSVGHWMFIEDLNDETKHQWVFYCYGDDSKNGISFDPQMKYYLGCIWNRNVPTPCRCAVPTRGEICRVGVGNAKQEGAREPHLEHLKGSGNVHLLCLRRHKLPVTNGIGFVIVIGVLPKMIHRYLVLRVVSRLRPFPYLRWRLPNEHSGYFFLIWHLHFSSRLNILVRF